jgi:serine/threonine-protein phosphatase 2A regulatory subunit A
VRLEAIQCLIKLKNEQFNEKWLESLLMEKLSEFSSHSKFAIRIHTLFIINSVFHELSDSFINEKLYKTFMKKLASDPVPNIRFNFAKTVKAIHNRLSNSSKMDSSEVLKKMQQSDDDFDVKFYAGQTL